MSVTAPFVTIVIPLFNGAVYISETLDSIAQQTFSDYEVLVVDDGSDDLGPAFAKAHRLGVRFFTQPNLGVAVARNRGLANARGQWVTFLDQDDLWHPTRLERLRAWLNEHPDERLVASTELAFDTEDERPALTNADPLVGSWASLHVPRTAAYATLCARADVSGSDAVQHVDVREMLRGPITVTTSFIADSELLRLAGGFAPHALAMDDYWLLVNAARLHRIAKVDQPTVFYRIHLGATSRTTRLALPFLSSAVALRMGGGLVGMKEGLAHNTAGVLHRHLLEEMLQSPEFNNPRVRQATRHLAALLWSDRAARLMLRAEVRRRLPWAVAAVRRLRGHAPAKRSVLRSPDGR